MILMCKDVEVFNIETEEVYNESLLPGYMIINSSNKTTFKKWLKLRYSSNTNTIARQLKGVTFGQGNRIIIDEQTYALSLSDCYWIKDENLNLKFSDVSPYYNDFWKGDGIYDEGMAIPTLYVGGYLTKAWESSLLLAKYSKSTLIESECSELCKLCDIEVVHITIMDNSEGVFVKNFTDTKFMLEQADQSGRIDPDDFCDSDIVDLFNLKGVQMLVIDAIVGNGDRHAGNFGWLRNTDTGEYVCMAPIYDFDHALDSKSDEDRLIRDIVSLVKKVDDYRLETIRICNMAKLNLKNDVFKNRANSILNLLSENF